MDQPTGTAVTATESTFEKYEHWAAKILAALLTAAYGTGLIPTTGVVAQIASMACVMLGYAGYVVLKKAAPMLLVALLAFTLTTTACGANKQAIAHAEFGCLKLVLPKLQTGEPLIALAADEAACLLAALGAKTTAAAPLGDAGSHD